MNISTKMATRGLSENLIKASYCKISQSLKATRFIFKIVRLLWNFDRHHSSSAADVPVKFKKPYDNSNNESLSFELSQDLI